MSLLLFLGESVCCCDETTALTKLCWLIRKKGRLSVLGRMGWMGRQIIITPLAKVRTGMGLGGVVEY